MRSLAKAVVPLAALAGAASAACPAVRCLGIPAGCQTAPVSYTKGGSADEFSFGSPTTGEWFLDVDDQTVTDHMEDPRAGDGTCPSDFETAGVDCACSHTRAELERHDRDASGGQDLLVQLEAAAGFTFSSRVRRHSLFSPLSTAAASLPAMNPLWPCYVCAAGERWPVLHHGSRRGRRRVGG